MNKDINYRQENSFDFLRLFAALTVVVQHSVIHLNLPFLWFKPDGGIWFSDGVPMFFILSGLLVFKSCENVFARNKPLSHYFINRYLRIAPGIYFYLVVTVLSFFVLVIIPLTDLKTTGFIAWFTSTVLLIPVYHPSNFSDFGVGVVNGSLWTIPVEFSFYIALPLMVLLMRKTNFKVMITLSFFLSVLSLVTISYLGNSETMFIKLLNVSFVPYLIFFSIGMFWSKSWKFVPHNGWLALTALSLYAVIRYEIIFDKEFFGPLFDCVWAAPFSYALIWFGYNAPSIFSKITNKIGDLSFGVYIWHMLVVNYFIYYNVPQKISWYGGTITNLLVIAITLMLAVVSWYCIEKQALRFKPYSSRSKVKFIPSQTKKVV